jgi:hypothetical protein
MPCRRLGTTYWSHLQGSGIQKKKKAVPRRALFSSNSRGIVVIPYRRLGTTYWSHLQRSGIQKKKKAVPRRALFASNSRRKLEITHRCGLVFGIARGLDAFTRFGLGITLLITHASSTWTYTLSVHYCVTFLLCWSGCIIRGKKGCLVRDVWALYFVRFFPPNHNVSVT